MLSSLLHKAIKQSKINFIKKVQTMQATKVANKEVHTAVKQAAKAAVHTFSKTAIYATYTNKRISNCKANIAGRIIKMHLYSLKASAEMLQAVKIAVQPYNCTAEIVKSFSNIYIKVLRKY
jgi:predicted ribonuclease toxin of YeeF-YezG toxin-antitoxin module